jgi:hypothetical protein
MKVTYPCCKFGIEYAFKQRNKIITIWWSVQNMETFVSNIAPILWEENVHSISVAVWFYVCKYICIFEMIVGIQLQSGNSAPNSIKNQPLTIPFEGGMHNFKRQFACVFRNGTYESEPPLKPLPLRIYEHFGTNSIIVLMFVGSQSVHIWSICKVCEINLVWWTVK